MPPRRKMPPIEPKPPGTTFSREIPSEHEMLIGRAVIAWSRLEKQIDEAIWAALRLSVEEGRIITAQQDAKHKIDMLRRLTRLHFDGTELTSASQLINEVEDLYGDRNLIVHGEWVMVMPDNVPGVLSLRVKLPENVPKNEVIFTRSAPGGMVKIIDRIMMVTIILGALCGRLSALLGTQPPQPPSD